MSQLYLQRFEYRVTRQNPNSSFRRGDGAPDVAKSGNWGGAETGIRHLKSYGTAWGGYVLIDVETLTASRVISYITV